MQWPPGLLATTPPRTTRPATGFHATDEARLMKPIALSDTQLDTIVRLAGALPPPDRDVYLREVAEMRIICRA